MLKDCPNVGDLLSTGGEYPYPWLDTWRDVVFEVVEHEFNVRPTLPRIKAPPELSRREADHALAIESLDPRHPSPWARSRVTFCKRLPVFGPLQEWRNRSRIGERRVCRRSQF